ncbi:MarR family winged helix-turn-helix transcriptional regulator [Fusibacter sp. JL298sf-3]
MNAVSEKRTKDLEVLMEEVLVLVPTLNKRFLREDELFKSEGLYPSHMQIMMLLSEHKQMTMSQISKGIHVINSNLTPLVDKLIKLGYLKRHPSNLDRRVVHITLTASGRKQVEKHKEYVKELLGSRLEELSDEEVEQFINQVKGISKVVHNCVDQQKL